MVAFFKETRASLGEKGAQVARSITPGETDEVVDATGLILLPGVIDPQVHFREPGLEHKEDLYTASLACAIWRCNLFSRNA